MTPDDVPRVSRRKRSRKKRRSSPTLRIVKVVGWSLLGIVITAIFVSGVIYFVGMRGARS